MRLLVADLEEIVLVVQSIVLLKVPSHVAMLISVLFLCVILL